MTPTLRTSPVDPRKFAHKRRLSLTRRWAEEGSIACFVMLNPSTADETTDDPTIRRCVGLARRWGHAALVVVNLYSLRATRPADLFRAANAQGARDDAAILAGALRADFVLAAWGAHGARNGRGDLVLALLRRAGVSVHAIGLTKRAQPRHPLYAPAHARSFVLHSEDALENARGQ